MTLPVPDKARWQPLRAGLVDLFYYDLEEFHFHDGRLLLRGNNGTGKSKVLALTLPFLLDGELSAHRVEPDGDRNKRMEWNLLLGGKHPHNERLGYTWLEFGRALPDGGAEYRTLGCGLKAVAGRGIAKHWFFVTDQRVGQDLSLVSPTRVALTREKLKDAVVGHGLVYDTASDYRRAVDEALFGLGSHRYEALVNLLIQLRQPQLSKKPDEKLLSRALTEALPPLDPALVATVAEAFRGLDEERETLRALAEAKTAAEQFLAHYRRYSRIAAKRRAAPVRHTHSAYEKLGRELGEAETAYEKATLALKETQSLLDELATTKAQLETRRAALESSPEMRNAEALKQVGKEAAKLREFSELRERDLLSAAGNLRLREEQAETARRTADDDAEILERAKEIAQAAADAAYLTDEHSALIADEDERAGQAIIERRTKAVDQLRRLLDAATQAEAALRSARASVDRITAEQQSAAERITAAEESVAGHGAALVDGYRYYLANAEQFVLSDMDELLDSLAAWTETLVGVSPAASAVEEAVLRATAELARRQATLDSERTAAENERRAITDEIARLEAGGHDAPPRPHTRDEDARTGRPGAPLWKVVDFLPGVDERHRAGLEAALEASGVLDAWVSPEGELHSTRTGDVVVEPGEAAPSGGLTAVLAPAVDRADPQASALTDDVVNAVLGAIGLGPGADTWVAVDGRFAIGVLTGAWHKDTAAYLGEGAREAARRERIQQLRDAGERMSLRLAELAEAADGLAAQRAALTAEHRARPEDTDLREAHSSLAGEHKEKRRIDGRLDEAVGVSAECADEAERSRGKAIEFAGDVGLPTDPEELARVHEAFGDYRVALAELWPAARALARAKADSAKAENEKRDAAERHAEARELAAEARAEAEIAAERHRVLVETAGAGVAELHRKLAAIASESDERDAHEKRVREEERVLHQDRGTAIGRRETLGDSISTAVAERDQAIGELRAFATTGLLTTALPDLDFPDPGKVWAANPAVSLARAINAALDGVDDADRPWELVQQKVSAEHKLLTDALSRHGHSVGMTVRDGIIVVDVLFQGRTQDIPTLVTALAVENEQRANLLSAKEREILENHLINEVAGTLQELIGDAEDQVRSINTDLEARPTSTGMRLRLQWRTSRTAPDGLDRVRDRLLRQTADAWSADDRTAVGGFLQEQINREHAEDAAGGWVEQLTRALDYRSWHEFAIQRYQDGQWRSATGPASGGERVLAASVPLFAAASSFYSSSANPYTPRLVALDEAFAGVDDDSRAKCLGLLAAFDLDVVMTSEREWGCYPQVPGLAIAQLTRRDGIDAVLVTPWRWDGRERVQRQRPLPYVPSA
ncbi:TIGR02680 family protein [Amycolatopsis keratiniphila]|uniref:TIGR02680 family protein n=1 Tax=Amycolatopsis keratiniphila TaxID=129921 RepID=UPI00087ACD03|nr:TIGR02680 family protein [Amycolatopsis keratiniphila]OLZ51902.1 TIGR02680 family protein [Amycolatopsis keratiniphila subsp. nogabecina]SDU62139.1 TIGR02680 family protein [Amycolatopsis keratiniphila]